MNVKLKSLIPHLVALLIFLVFASIYFSPLFKGYHLIQDDVNKFKGMSKEIVDHRVMNETEPLWTNSMFGGMPAYQISVLHSNNYINTIDQIIKVGLPRPAGILFIAMLGFYILLMCLRVNPWLAIAGAIAFGFSTINILYLGAGHMSKVNAIAYMAPALGGLILAFRGKWLLGSAVFTLFLSLNLSANHLQMTYYLMFIMAFVALGEIIRIIIEKQYKTLIPILSGLFIGVIIAILPSMSNILTTQEYSKHSTRGKTELTIEPDGKKINLSKKSGLDTDYILKYNYGEGELLSTIIPNARGERGNVFGEDEDLMVYIADRDIENGKDFSNDETFTKGINRYWGGQAMSGGAFYFGAVIFVLFFLAILFLNDALKWSLVAVVILALSLASNDPGGMNDFFIHKFPLYNKFRDSKMILVLLQIIFPLLAILFMDAVFNGRISFYKKQKFYTAGGAVVVFFSLLYISPSMSGDFMTSEENKQFTKILGEQEKPEVKTYYNDLKKEIKEARKFLFKKDVGRALIFSLFILGLIYAMIIKKPSIWIVSGSLLLLVSIDNIGVALRYLNSDEDIDDKRGEMMNISILTAQNYLEEGEEIPALNKYENSKLALLPPNIPSVSDISILEREKKNISNFDQKVAQYKKKMSSYYMFEEIKSEKTKNILSEFASLNLNSDYRVLRLGNPFNETQTSYYHKSIGGYHGAKLKRYQEVIDFYITKEHENIYAKIQKELNKMHLLRPKLYDKLRSVQKEEEKQKIYLEFINSTDFNYLDFNESDTRVLNMLNTRYFITGEKSNSKINKSAYGNAWFVSNVKIVKTADEAMQALGDSSIDLRTTAVIHKDFKNIKTPRNIDSAKISLTKYGLNHLEYTTSSEYAGPAVFSEIYYPDGWNCYIDGKLVEHFRVNYILRGVMVPAGKHKIEWKFEPKSMETGSLVSGIGSVLLILSCLAIFFIEIKNIKTAADE